MYLVILFLNRKLCFLSILLSWPMCLAMGSPVVVVALLFFLDILHFEKGDTMRSMFHENELCLMWSIRADWALILTIVYAALLLLTIIMLCVQVFSSNRYSTWVFPKRWWFESIKIHLFSYILNSCGMDANDNYKEKKRVFLQNLS
ncbi:hypothetical protein NE237_030299 [Protea cynaroides]|uniref:Uncharacterized protein n=1 Tax=Protea cynaroides TaxID=273540 RepID=A0A9Q0GSS5_9MAGN|nr:hypothetical protein NE237_030299 [Protea cynaroides]